MAISNEAKLCALLSNNAHIYDLVQNIRRQAPNVNWECDEIVKVLRGQNEIFEKEFGNGEET